MTSDSLALVSEQLASSDALVARGANKCLLVVLTSAVVEIDRIVYIKYIKLQGQ